MSNKTRYGGTYLRVDLSAGRIESQTVDEATQRAYPGGSSYGARVLYDEVPPGVEWSDPENRLIVASGPLGGTRVGGSGTISVVTPSRPRWWRMGASSLPGRNADSMRRPSPPLSPSPRP